MFKNPELPSCLWPLRDAIVDHANGNAQEPQNLENLYEWLQNDGWDSLIGSDSEQEMALKLCELAQYQFLDSEFSVIEDLAPGEVITNSMRLSYAKGVIAMACSGDDGYLCPTLHSYKLEHSDGSRAIVGASVEIHGQAGAVAVWQGVHSTRDNFFATMKRCDIWLIEDAKNIDDDSILRLWQREI